MVMMLVVDGRAFAVNRNRMKLKLLLIIQIKIFVHVWVFDFDQNYSAHITIVSLAAIQPRPTGRIITEPEEEEKEEMALWQ